MTLSIVKFFIFSSLMTSLVSIHTGCVTTSQKPKDANRVSIMSYNAENLFDTLDDPGKDDETYLPLEKKKNAKIQSICRKISFDHYRKQCLTIDWSEKVLANKLSRLADVILQVNNGFGPDILILQEVENKRVLELLRKNYLQKADYKEAILIEGPDKRGIDVGILSRFSPSKKPQLHNVSWKKGSGRDGQDPRPSRGIIEANFTLPDKTPLNIFGVHFPSQYNPYPVRQQAIAKLNSLIKGKPANNITIAGGDFNVSSDEDATEEVFSKVLSKQWFVSHLIGCKKCDGTYYYHKKRSWSFFDVLLFSKNLYPQKNSKPSTGWEINPKSIYIPKSNIFQISRFVTPARFKNGRGPRGVSDHWPIYAEITLRNPTTQKTK